MLMYKSLEIDYLDIKEQVYSYIKNNTSILNTTLFWNLVPGEPLAKNCSALQKFLSEHNLTPKVSGIIHIASADQYDNAIHTDHDKAIVILFPILNCDNSITEFFKVPDQEIIYNVELRNARKVNQNKKLNIPIYNVAIRDEYEKIDEFSLTKPHIFNTGVPHRIKFTQDSVFPRLSLALRVNEDLSRLF